MNALCLNARIIPITQAPTTTNPSHITTTSAISSSSLPKTGPCGFSLKYPLASLFPTACNRHAVAVEDTVSVNRMEESEKNGNWVLRVLQVRSLWKAQGNNHGIQEGDEQVNNRVEKKDHDNEVSINQECDACMVDDDDDDDKVEFDKSSFSKLLWTVSLAEARLYAQMAYLGSLSYTIPQIKPENLLKHHRLRFVTSSLEKKADKEKASEEVQEGEGGTKRKEARTLEKGTYRYGEHEEEEEETKYPVENQEKGDGNRISPSTAYQIAASYLQSHTKSIIPFKSLKTDASDHSSSEGESKVADNVSMTNREAASTNTETAVVAAKDELKQSVADDLNLTCSSPCEWFICDDDESSMRYFVIQGSESIASWQANLLFEPTQFEALDVIVHRGIYEVAKVVYEEMLPRVHEHLERHGNHATFRFTGHSLGGSLSLLVNLMLLIRGQVPLSSLLPVITFGAPWVMCGGDGLLHKLGLPTSHLQGITMHRDIVPRAFSCNYPSRVAELLKAVNVNFRNHPCLDNQNVLYAPMGDFLILQPDAKVSPSHDLLPSGSGLYVLRSQASDAGESEKQTRAAQSAFLNTPHPLEILSDCSAYGSEGAILRDHDVETYLTSIWSVIHQGLNRVRRMRREHGRRQFWWPLVAGLGEMGVDQSEVKLLSGVLDGGRECLKRLRTLVGSQHMHMHMHMHMLVLVVFLVPVRLLIMELEAMQWAKKAGDVNGSGFL